MIGFRRLTALAVACAASAIACSSSSGSGGGGSGTPMTLEGGTTMGGGSGEGGGPGEDGGTMIPPSTDASASSGPTAACVMGSTNQCVSPYNVSMCSAVGGTLMSTCPSAGLAGCCTTKNVETCFYSVTTSAAMANCTSGMFSTSP